jgi:hypothetical protein
MIKQETQTGPARHLYVICVYGAIGLQTSKICARDPAIFWKGTYILIVIYVVFKFILKFVRFKSFFIYINGNHFALQICTMYVKISSTVVATYTVM